MAIPVTAGAFTQKTVTQLTHTLAHLPYEGYDPVIDGSHVYVAFTTQGSVILDVSQDSGTTFNPMRLDDGAGEPKFPKTVASLNHIYIVWASIAGGVTTYKFRQSADFGATFGPIVDLSTANFPARLPGDGSVAPVIVAEKDLVTVGVYTGTPGEVSLMSSHDGGTSFPFVTTIPSSNVASELYIARGAGTVYVTWQQGPQNTTGMVAASNDNGKSFLVQQLTTVASLEEPILAVSGVTGRAFIYCRDSGFPRIGHLSISDDHGTTWQLGQSFGTKARKGDLVVHGRRVYVTFSQQESAGEYHVFLSFSLDNGDTFSTPADISGSTGIKNTMPKFAPWMSAGVGRSANFSILWMTATSVFVRSTTDITLGMDPPLLLGPGTSGTVVGNQALWLSPQNFVEYARMQ
jgi:hypothetical protein